MNEFHFFSKYENLPLTTFFLDIFSRACSRENVPSKKGDNYSDKVTWFLQIWIWHSEDEKNHLRKMKNPQIFGRIYEVHFCGF